MFPAKQKTPEIKSETNFQKNKLLLNKGMHEKADLMFER